MEKIMILKKINCDSYYLETYLMLCKLIIHLMSTYVFAVITFVLALDCVLEKRLSKTTF